MWYVTRGGAVDGPVGEDELRAAFARGELADAQVCRVGDSEWLRPETVFRESAAIAAPTRARPETARAPRAVDIPTESRLVIPEPARERRRMRPLVVVLAGVLALGLLGGGAAVLYAVITKPAPTLTTSIPASVTFYAEVPSWKRVLEGMASMKIADASRLDTAETAEGAVRALASAFNLSKIDAASLGAVIGSVAVAGRSGQDIGSALLLSVSAEAPVEVLLKTNRFSPGGALGSVRMYQLAAAPAAKDAPLFERTLRELSTEGTRKRVLWFAERHLLVLGDESFVREVADVVANGKPALEQRDLYLKAGKHVDVSAVGVTFIDEQMFKDHTDAAERKALDGFLHDGGPLGASVRFGPAGVIVTGFATFTGATVPVEEPPAAEALTIPERLPGETIAYVAGSTRRGMKPAQAKAAVVKALLSANAGTDTDVSVAVDRFEARVGVTVEDLFKVVGDECAFAVLVDKDFKYGSGAPFAAAAPTGLGALFVLKVDDDLTAKAVLMKLHDRATTPDLAEWVTVSPDGDGFILTPTAIATKAVGGAAPLVHVTYGNREIAIAMASSTMADRALAALASGKGTLRDDGGHALARSALRPKARAYGWIDVGRIATLAFTANPADRADARAAGLPVDAIKLVGDDRVTAAFDVDYHVKDGTSTVEVEMVNPWAFSLFTGVDAPVSRQAFAAALARAPQAVDPVPPAPVFPSAPVLPVPAPLVMPTGIAVCDEYIAKLEICGPRFASQAATQRKTYAQMSEHGKAKAAAKTCAKQLKGLKKACK